MIVLPARPESAARLMARSRTLEAAIDRALCEYGDEVARRMLDSMDHDAVDDPPAGFFPSGRGDGIEVQDLVWPVVELGLLRGHEVERLAHFTTLLR